MHIYTAQLMQRSSQLIIIYPHLCLNVNLLSVSLPSILRKSASSNKVNGAPKQGVMTVPPNQKDT
jgi:hypothetical protein